LALNLFEFVVLKTAGGGHLKNMFEFLRFGRLEKNMSYILVLKLLEGTGIFETLNCLGVLFMRVERWNITDEPLGKTQGRF
jgi:hypothetical protein